MFIIATVFSWYNFFFFETIGLLYPRAKEIKENPKAVETAVKFLQFSQSQQNDVKHILTSDVIRKEAQAMDKAFKTATVQENGAQGKNWWNVKYHLFPSQFERLKTKFYDDWKLNLKLFNCWADTVT